MKSFKEQCFLFRFDHTFDISFHFLKKRYDDYIFNQFGQFSMFTVKDFDTDVIYCLQFSKLPRPYFHSSTWFSKQSCSLERFKRKIKYFPTCDKSTAGTLFHCFIYFSANCRKSEDQQFPLYFLALSFRRSFFEIPEV